MELTITIQDEETGLAIEEYSILNQEDYIQFIRPVIEKYATDREYIKEIK